MLKILSAALLLSACGPSAVPGATAAEDVGGQTAASSGAGPAGQAGPPPDFESHAGDLDWRDLLAADDRQSLDRLDVTWAGIVAQGRAEGSGPEMDALGEGLDPDAAFPVLTPPESVEHVCRRVRLDARNDGPAVQPFEAFRCAVATLTQGRLSLTSVTGAPVLDGVLHPESHGRMLFIGRFGRDGAGTEAFGVLEQIDEGYWRIVLPKSGNTQRLDILEIWTLPSI